MDLRAGGARIALVMTALMACGTATAAPVRPEIYSDVCLDEETGDQNGSELVLWRTPVRPQIRFTLCEGGCGQPENVIETHLSGRRLSFVVREDYTDGHGHPNGSQTMRFTAVLGPRYALLRSPGSEEPGRLPRRATFHRPARVRGMCR